MAKATPTDIVAGRAGGTVIVIKSADYLISIGAVRPILIKIGNVPQKPTIATNAMAPTNVSESL